MTGEFILLNCVGSILDGSEAGFRLKVAPSNPSNPGFGYLILIFDPDRNEGYDYWAETVAEVEEMISAFGWRIQWDCNP